MTRVRSLAVAATGALAVFGTVAVAGAQHNLQSGLNNGTREWNRAADVWVSPSGDDNTLGDHAVSRLGGVQARHLQTYAAWASTGGASSTSATAACG